MRTTATNDKPPATTICSVVAYNSYCDVEINPPTIDLLVWKMDEVTTLIFCAMLAVVQMAGNKPKTLFQEWRTPSVQSRYICCHEDTLVSQDCRLSISQHHKPYIQVFCTSNVASIRECLYSHASPLKSLKRIRLKFVLTDNGTIKLR